MEQRMMEWVSAETGERGGHGSKKGKLILYGFGASLSITNAANSPAMGTSIGLPS